ncbi:hypothetical protein O181_026510 [Austropuccinia psidii MF-1]|uniref:Peptidase A2 domain-containing protein n=1 Tax=Austropuccinia psidii MF-1 TaxID=1389203 RepID=A0A9Q3CPF6_9BASI|nr:hypothetical protein [Austropuccinia psidii MF-1]
MSKSIKKVLEQKINLTLDQFLIISPKVIKQLKNLTTEERSLINSLDTKEIQTKLINHHLGDYEQPKLHYSCPLGFMQVYLREEGHEIMALVDTGSELNIIPEYSEIKAGLTTRCLNMNLRGIGGHCTSSVGLAEFTPITLDNNIRLDFSQQKGEIFGDIEPDGRRLCLPICAPQKVGWRENPPAGMETCAVSKLEDWKELSVEKEPSSSNQEILEEHPHQAFKEEEIMESEDIREIKVELASFNTEDIKQKLKEMDLTGIKTSRREKVKNCNQISQAMNRDNFENHEDIRRKPLTKFLSPIKALKSLSKGIFKNKWKSSVKPVISIINFTEEARNLHSHPDTPALNSLKEISIKDKITINKDKESAELNKILENIIVNQPTNGKDYGQETTNKESKKTNIKNNMDENQSYHKK